MSRLLFLIAFSAVVRAQEMGCPKTLREWAIWREDFLSHVVILDDLIDPNQNLIEVCAKDPEQAKFFENPELLACLAPIRETTKSLGTVLDSDSYKFKEYSENPDVVEATRLPSEYSVESLKKKDERKKMVQEIIKKFPGAVAVEKVDHFLVLLPGADRDRWFNFGDDGVLAVTIQKTDAEHKPLKKPLTYFNSYGDNGHANVSSRIDNPYQCTMCHRTGAVPILEKTDTEGAIQSMNSDLSNEQAAEKMNQAVKATANAIPFQLNMEPFGPPMGETDRPGRTLDFIKECSRFALKKPSSKSLERVQNAMSCARCHNGGRAGILSAPLGKSGGPLLSSLIMSGHMPPGSDNRRDKKNYMTKEEREALATCLSFEYYGYTGVDSLGKKRRNLGVFVSSLQKPACPREKGEGNVRKPNDQKKIHTPP